MAAGPISLSPDEVEETPSLSTDQVEESAPKQYLPEVNQAVSTVPRPPVPTGLQPSAPAPSIGARLKQGAQAVEGVVAPRKSDLGMFDLLGAAATGKAEFGESVPQAAVPALQTAKKVFVDPFDKTASAISKASGELLEGAAAVPQTARIATGAPPSNVGTPTPRPPIDPAQGKRLADWMRSPQAATQPPPADLQQAATRSTTAPPSVFGEMMENAQAERPIELGVAKGVGETVGGIVGDPRYLPFFGSSLARPALARLISAGFTAQMGIGTSEGAKELYQKWDQMKPAERAELATKTGITALFLAHGTIKTGGGYEALPKEPIARAESLFRNLIYKAGGTVPENPTFEQANVAYRAAMNNLHPDVSPATAEDAQNLNAAWATMKTAGRFAQAPPVPTPTRNELAEHLDRTHFESGDAAKASYVAEKQAQEAPVEAKPKAPEAEVIPPSKPSPAAPEVAKPIVLEANQVEEAPKPATVSPKESRAPQGAKPRAGGKPAAEPVSKPAAESAPVVAKPGVEETAATPSKEQPTEKPEIVKGGKVELPDGRRATIEYAAPADKLPVVRLSTEDGEKVKLTSQKEIDGLKAATKYKYGSTQADIPESSEAHSSLEAARARISDSDLAGQGKDVGGNHVTVRYGIQSEDVEGVKKYLVSLAPFEASLGKTDKFPPSPNSDGAAVIHAPIESPELQKINAELEKHGDFTEPSFKEYKPHATVAYVDPAKAGRYTGMSVTEGKKFPVNEIAITDKNGGQTVVKLEGKKEPARTPTGRLLTPEELDIQNQPGTTGVAKDIDKWQPPPELGAFPNTPDVGAKARAQVDKESGPLKRGEERRKVDRTGQQEEDRLFTQARKELGEDATTEQIEKRIEELRKATAEVKPSKEADLALEIKSLREQAKKVSEEFSLQSLRGYDPHSPLRAKYNQLLKDAGDREDELARLRGEPTRSEKREAAKAAAEKKFADRPETSMKYGELGQGQHWQVLEPDYIEKRFQQEVDRYKRAIVEQEAKIKELGPKTGQQKVSLEKATLEMWKKILDDNQSREPRKAQKFKEEYRKLVKEAVSHGSPVPQEVIGQLPEFKLAQDARERYEKGLHTSFANRSAAINDTMQKEEGFKVKRQDGKPITEEQIKEISTGVEEMVKVLGPELRDMMRGTDLTISHTSGKHPFLSDAGGQYHPLDKSISAGINNFLGKPIKALAHEMGHWLDFEAGRVLNTKAMIRPKSGGPSRDTSYISEADRSTKPLYELARRTMSDTYRAEKMIKTTKLADLPDEQREEVEVMKVVLGPYWREPRELWARMFEQYIATKFGAGGVSMQTPVQYQSKPAYWPKEAWAKIDPLFEEALKTRMDAMRERYAPSAIEGESTATATPPPSAPEATKPAAPATKEPKWKVGDVVTFTKTAPGSYLKPNESYVVEAVSKNSVQFRNPRTGGGTSDNLKMLTLAEYTKEPKAEAKPAVAEEAARVVPGARSASTGNETGKTSIQDLTDSISRQVPEKRPLKDRISRGADIGEKTGDAKDSLGRAYDRIKGAASALWDAYHRPPKWTDYEDLTGKWSGADQINALDLERFSKAIVRAVPEKLRREAISNWIEAEGDDAVLRDRAEKSAAPYKKGYEAALHLSDAETTIARNIMNRNDATLEEAQKAGILQQGVENYVRHVYADSPKYQAKVAAEMNFASLQTKPSFTKERKLPTYFDAEQLGFTPKDKDVGYLTAIHERSFREALAARAYVHALMHGKATDGRPLVATSWASAKELSPRDGEASAAYLIKPNVKAEEEFGDYRKLDHPALRGWRWAGKTSEGAPIFVQGDAIVHPEIFRNLKNNLTKSAIRSYETEILGHTVHPGAFVLNASAEIKHAILSFSGFHQTTLAAHAAEHRTLPAGMPELDLNEPKQRKLVEHGLMVAQYDAEEAFGEGVASGGLVTKIPGIGPLYHHYTQYLFHSFLPRIKMGTSLNALDRNFSRYKGKLSEDQIYAITAAQGNASFGGLNYRMLGRNKTIQDVLRLGLMAPDFFEARARYAGQAAKPYGREQLVALIGGGLVIYALLRILNEITDRDSHWDKPFSVVYRDKEYTMRLIQEDIFRAVTDPGKYLMNRLSPVVSTAIHLGEGRNEFGRKESVGEIIKQTAKREVPIPLQPWTRESKDTNAQKAVETIAKMVGVNMKNAHEASEERLREKERAGRETEKELEDAAKAGDTATVEKIENDPEKLRLISEHETWAGYLSELRKLDSEIKDVKLASGISREDRRAYLDSLRDARKELLRQADEAAKQK